MHTNFTVMRRHLLNLEIPGLKFDMALQLDLNAKGTTDVKFQVCLATMAHSAPQSVAAVTIRFCAIMLALGVKQKFVIDLASLKRQLYAYAYFPYMPMLALLFIKWQLWSWLATHFIHGEDPMGPWVLKCKTDILIFIKWRGKSLVQQIESSPPTNFQAHCRCLVLKYLRL